MERNDMEKYNTAHGAGVACLEPPNSRSLRKILITDDDPAVRSVVRRLLESEGYSNISEAADGNEGVAVSRKINPDLIMMDYYMGGMDGLEATRKIKEEMPAINVIVMTGQPMPSLVKDCMSAGASSFIIKPFDRKELMNVVKNRI